jgi:hypothetical protein
MGPALEWATNVKTGSPLKKLLLTRIADGAAMNWSYPLGVDALARYVECSPMDTNLALNELKTGNLIFVRDKRIYLIAPGARYDT